VIAIAAVIEAALYTVAHAFDFSAKLFDGGVGALEVFIGTIYSAAQFGGATVYDVFEAFFYAVAYMLESVFG
jgi:hypothetical protein